MNRSRRPHRPSQRLAVLALLAGACAGPVEPLAVGHHLHRSDIVLGALPVVQGAPEPPVALPPTSLPVRRVIIRVGPPASPVAPPPPPMPTIPPAPPVACPAASPIASPVLVAPNDVLTAPAPGTYTFRNEGRYEVSGASAGKGTVEGEGTRTISNVQRVDADTYRYDVEATLEDTTTTTTYLVTPGAEDGILIDKVVTRSGVEGADDYEESTFDPTPDLRILAFPVETGTVWSATGVDPATGQAMTYDARVVVKDRADACGDLVDTIVVEVDGSFLPCDDLPPEAEEVVGGLLEPEPAACDVGGRLVEPASGSSSTFHARYEFATQYGGLVVEDFSEILTESPGTNLFRTNTAVINQLPLAPIAIDDLPFVDEAPA